MNNISFSSALLSTFAALVLSAPISTALARGIERPFLSKTESGGWVPAEYSNSLQCKIFANRVERTVVQGFFQKTETFPVSIVSHPSLNNAIADAKKSSLRVLGPVPQDAGGSTYTASSQSVDDVLLSGIEGDSYVENSSQYTDALIIMADSLCGGNPR